MKWKIEIGNSRAARVFTVLATIFAAIAILWPRTVPLFAVVLALAVLYCIDEATITRVHHRSQAHRKKARRKVNSK